MRQNEALYERVYIYQLFAAVFVVGSRVFLSRICIRQTVYFDSV